MRVAVSERASKRVSVSRKRGREKCSCIERSGYEVDDKIEGESVLMKKIPDTLRSRENSRSTASCRSINSKGFFPLICFCSGDLRDPQASGERRLRVFVPRLVLRLALFVAGLPEIYYVLHVERCMAKAWEGPGDFLVVVVGLWCFFCCIRRQR